MPRQHNLARVLPAQRAARAKGLTEGIDRLPTQPGEKLNGGLLDQGVF